MTDFVAGDTDAVLTAVCYDSNRNKIDLTGRTLTLRWRYTTTGSMTATATMTNSNQTTNKGEATWKWTTGQLQSPKMVYDVVITDDITGKYITQLDEVVLNVRARA